jgi:hypothetical protein
MDIARHVYNDTKSRVILASLGLTLEAGQVSEEAFDVQALGNREVTNMVNGGYIKLVTLEEVSQLKRAPAAAPKAPEVRKPDAPIATHESDFKGGSFEDGSPTGSPRIDQLLSTIKASFAELEQLIQPRKEAPEDTSPSSEESEDSSIPSTPPPGMQPSQACSEFLKKSYMEKMRFLNQCRDIGLVREIIMFDELSRIKGLARKREKEIDKENSNVPS